MTVFAVVAAALLVGVAGLQGLLAAGLPLGHLAYGGQQPVLPGRLRVASAVATLVLLAAAWLVLARAALVAPGAEPLAVRVATLVFAGFFCLNTVGNLMSASRAERLVMTPITVVLAVCFAVVGLS